MNLNMKTRANGRVKNGPLADFRARNRTPSIPTMDDGPTPLYPPERVRLGWQSIQSMSVGSGFDNTTGSICYINAVLQAIFHVPAFANWLVNDEQHRQTCGKQQKQDIYDCVVCMMFETFSMWQKHTGFSIAPTIASHLNLICTHLSTKRQEDAHEFLRYLMESMERCYLSVLGYNTNDLDRCRRETNPINQIFGGHIRTEVTCGKCGLISTTFQHFQDLILDISQSDTVNDALDKYFEKEPVGESYICESCQHRIGAVKQFSIEKAPNVLCIQLKRYIVSEFNVNKNNKAIQIDEQLDLTSYQFQPYKHKTDVCPLRYHLVSMVNHYGSTLTEGHYTTIGLTPSGSYYYFNDSKVHPINFKNYSTSNDSYLIFYELVSSGNTNSKNLEIKTSTVTSSSASQIVSTSIKSPVNGFFSNKTNEVAKPFNSITKSLNGSKIIQKDKNKTTYNKLKTKRFKQGNQKNKFEPYVTSIKKVAAQTNEVQIKFVPFYREWDLIWFQLSTGIQQRNGLKKTLDPLKNVKPLSIFDSSLTNYFNKEDDLFLVKSP